MNVGSKRSRRVCDLGLLVCGLRSDVTLRLAMGRLSMLRGVKDQDEGEDEERGEKPSLVGTGRCDDG